MTQEKPKILIVDDKPENLYALEKLLKKLDVEVVQALSGAEALSLSLEQDFCIAIIDVQMPEMDGYELVELLRSNEDTATLPVIFVSAIYSDEYHHRKGYEAGAVDFMSKPLVPEILQGKVNVFIDLYRQRKVLQDEIKQRQQAEEGLTRFNEQLEELVQQRTKELGDAYHELAKAYDLTLDGWSRALDLRDAETEGHTQRVTELTELLAHAVGLNGTELVNIRRGALLHDIGKMGIPDSILLKTGPLTDAEMAIMRKHPGYAYEFLSPIAFLRPAIAIPYCHHEKWDGTGYPQGLKGEQIPLAARLFAVVDVWDALCSDRPYRENIPLEEAREYIIQQSGKYFDPRVVDVFTKLDKSLYYDLYRGR